MLELVDECFMCAFSIVCGDVAISRVPVISASGERLSWKTWSYGSRFGVHCNGCVKDSWGL
jgi:hypothetical protein